MKEIHTSIKGIRSEVKNIQKSTAGMIGDYANERSQGAAEWNKMQDSIAQMREKGVEKPQKSTAKAERIKEVKIETPVETVKENKAEVKQEVELQPEVTMTLADEVMAYINKHPMGVKISEMEAPLGETRMKLGFIAKTLLDEGKVQKMDNIYFPIK
jgi:phage protein D